MPTKVEVMQAITEGYGKYQVENQYLLTRALTAVGAFGDHPVVSQAKMYLANKADDDSLTSTDALALTNLLAEDMNQIIAENIQYRQNPLQTADPDILTELCFNKNRYLASDLHTSVAFHVWHEIMECFGLVSPLLVFDPSNPPTDEEFNNRVLAWETSVFLYNLRNANIQISERSFRSLEALRLIQKDTNNVFRSQTQSMQLSQAQFSVIEALHTSPAPSISSINSISTVTIGATATLNNELLVIPVTYQGNLTDTLS